MLYRNAFNQTILFILLKKKNIILASLILIIMISASFYSTFILNKADSLSIFIATTKNKQMLLGGFLPSSLLSLLAINSAKDLSLIRYGDRYWNTILDLMKIILVQSFLISIYIITIWISYLLLKNKIVTFELPSNFYLILSYSILTLWLASIVISFFISIIQYIFKNKGATILIIFLLVFLDSGIYNQFHTSLLWSHGLVLQEKDLYVGGSSLNTILSLLGFLLIIIAIHFFVSSKIDLINEGYEHENT